MGMVANQTFRWSPKFKGTGIELSNDNLYVWLKETAYMFRTLLGDTVDFIFEIFLGFQ